MILTNKGKLIIGLFILFISSFFVDTYAHNKRSKANEQPTVVLFIIDGLMPDAAEVAIKNGAENLKFFMKNGVTVDEAYCLSPARRVTLPDGSEPWGGATPPNLGMHTGTHLFENSHIDDVFLSARRSGIKSVFSGGHDLYKVFTTPDYTYAQTGYSDNQVVQHAIDHVKKGGINFFRLHLQEIRYSWSGPESRINPKSDYQKSILNADKELGRFVECLKSEGLWENCYFIISSDHGMGQGKETRHYANDLTSWKIYMNFYGKGIKKGVSIPYAESPDVAIMVNHLLKSDDLKGYTVKTDRLKIVKPTGILLSNIFEGNSDTVEHPMWVKKYLIRSNWKPEKSYLHYRNNIMELINQSFNTEEN